MFSSFIGYGFILVAVLAVEFLEFGKMNIQKSLMKNTSTQKMGMWMSLKLVFSIVIAT